MATRRPFPAPCALVAPQVRRRIEQAARRGGLTFAWLPAAELFAAGESGRAESAHFPRAEACAELAGVGAAVFVATTRRGGDPLEALGLPGRE